jgi:hypothetical protein
MKGTVVFIGTTGRVILIHWTPPRPNTRSVAKSVCSSGLCSSAPSVVY